MSIGTYNAAHDRGEIIWNWNKNHKQFVSQFVIGSNWNNLFAIDCCIICQVENKSETKLTKTEAWQKKRTRPNGIRITSRHESFKWFLLPFFSGAESFVTQFKLVFVILLEQINNFVSFTGLKCIFNMFWMASTSQLSQFSPKWQSDSAECSIFKNSSKTNEIEWANTHAFAHNICSSIVAFICPFRLIGRPSRANRKSEEQEMRLYIAIIETEKFPPCDNFNSGERKRSTHLMRWNFSRRKYLSRRSGNCVSISHRNLIKIDFMCHLMLHRKCVPPTTTMRERDTGQVSKTANRKTVRLKIDSKWPANDDDQLRFHSLNNRFYLPIFLAVVVHTVHAINY